MSSAYQRRSAITIRYISYRYSDPSTEIQHKLPMIHVLITHKGKDLATTALVDSGATGTFFPKELAEILDLDLTGQTHRTIGANGSFETVPSLIGKCSLVKGKSRAFENFTNLRVSVPVDPNTLPYMVFGRDSIFQKFNITFQEKNEKIVLRRT